MAWDELGVKPDVIELDLRRTCPPFQDAPDTMLFYQIFVCQICKQCGWT